MAREFFARGARGSSPKRPRRFQVVLLCDLSTSSGMILRLLRAVFNKSSDEALHLMLAARRSGATPVAVTTHEVAETKAKMAAEFATRERQPVNLRVEPAL